MNFKIGFSVCALLSACCGMAIAQEKTPPAATSSRPTESVKSASEGLMREAKVHQDARRYQEALSLYEQALALRERDVTQVADAAVSAYRVGLMHWNLMQYPEAQAAFQRAVMLDEKVYGSNHFEVASDLSALAGIYDTRGQYEDALLVYQRVLAIQQQQFGENHPAVASTLDGQIYLLSQMGRYAKALAAAQRALTIREAIFGGNHSGVAESLDRLASIYGEVGRYVDALPLHRRALAIREMLYGVENETTTAALNNLANDLDDLGQWAEAITHQQRALAILEKTKKTESVLGATVLSNLAYAYRETGKFAEALPLFLRSLAIKEKLLGSQHPEIARTLRHIGVLYLNTGKPAEAQPYLERALMIMSQAGKSSPALVAQVLRSVSEMYRMKNQPELAILYGKQAINTLQAVRAGNTQLDKESQKGYLKKNEASYKALADLLFSQGRLMEGQQVLAMLKEAEYFDFIQRNTAADPRKTQATFDGKEQPWANRYTEISGQLAALSKEREALIKKSAQGLTAAEQSRKDVLDADFSVARKAYDAFMVELKREFTQSESAGRTQDERKQALGEKNLSTLRALQGTLRDLGHGAVTLHYLMTDKRVWILLTTPSVQITREASINEIDLNKQIGEYREAIANRDPKIKELGKALYDLIIAPVAEDLKQAGAQTLMLSLDGSLRYLPIAALYDGEKYLAQRYRLAIYTTAATAQLNVQPKAKWNLAGYGMTRAATVGEQNFNALTSVKGELEGITQDMKGTVKLDSDFTAKSLQTGLESGSSVVHLASHFIFKPGNETDSFLLMGDGNPLSLATIRDYTFTNVDLLTLSACETAVGGGKDANGREVEGFGVQAQEQGAKAVIATLWPVADQSTGQFMQLLYGFRQKNQGMTKAEAMQKAQVAFIEGHVKQSLTEVSRSPVRPSATKAAITTTDHPYYWAPFILMGNWL